MPRGKRPQPWMKLHGTFLDSSINYEMDLAQQCVFLKLALFSMRIGNRPGIISDNDGKPLPLQYVADCIHAPISIVEKTVDIGVKTERIKYNGAGVIEIVNWNNYQSEYERQKPYREAKKADRLARHGVKTAKDREMMQKYRKGKITHEAYMKYLDDKEAGNDENSAD